MSSKNEKHFYRRLNIQVCELLQVPREAAIGRCFEKKAFMGKHLGKAAGLQAQRWQLQKINFFTDIYQGFNPYVAPMYCCKSSINF